MLLYIEGAAAYVTNKRGKLVKKGEAEIHGSKTFIFLTLIICLLLPPDLTSATQRAEGGVAGEGASAREGINQQIHRMCLLRVKLMHFVNSLHNYIVTRVRPGPLCFVSTCLQRSLEWMV